MPVPLTSQEIDRWRRVLATVAKLQSAELPAAKDLLSQRVSEAMTPIPNPDATQRAK